MAQQTDMTFGSVGRVAHSSPNVLIGEPSPNSVRSDPHWPHRASAPLHSKRVLLAEDDDDLREVMSIFLTLAGYSVTDCSDAERASEAFHKDSLIDILMTDLEMPGRSGLELARELTALRPPLAVMIVSAALLTPAMFAEIKDRNWTYVSKTMRFADAFRHFAIFAQQTTRKQDSLSAFAILIPALGSKKTPANDSALLTQVCAGDAGAIQQLFDRHATLVYSVAMRILQGSKTAEDVLHEVFMQLWREPNSFRGLDLGGSLVLLARNRATDRLRSRLGREYDVPAVLIRPHRATQPMELSAACLSKHTPTTEMQQSVLQMAFFEGKTMEVIGEELGVTPAAIRTQMRLGFQRGVGAGLSMPGEQSDG